MTDEITDRNATMVFFHLLNVGNVPITENDTPVLEARQPTPNLSS